MKTWISAFALLLLVSACGQDNQQATTNQKGDAAQTGAAQNGFKQAELDAIMDRYENDHEFMGSVAVAQAGKVIYTRAAGYRDYENKIKATPDTKYRIGSVSKTFTALLALMAVDEGKLSLDDSLAAYYPRVPNADKITIAHMLAHRSGLPSYTRDPEFKDIVFKGVTQDAMLKRFEGYEGQFPPGEKEDYSNTNIYLMTLILERIYQKSYAQLITDKIADPLKLKHTYYAKTLSADKNEAYSYHTKDKITRAPAFHHSTMLGAGGLVSTPSELTQVYNALFSDQIIKPETLARMIDIDQTFGLGIEKMTYTGRVSYGHRGRVAEFNSIVLYHEKEKISIAISDNGSFGDMPAIIKDILGAYFKSDKVAISIEDLDKFAGTYQAVKSSDDHSVFEREGHKLINVIKGEFRAELVYKGNNSFLLDQSYAPAITFVFSEDGQQMTFKQRNSAFDYKKVK